MGKPLPKISFQDQFITFRKAAVLSGIPYDTLRSRYLRGDRGDDLFRPVQETSARHLLTMAGKTQTIRQWADEFGIRYETLRQRVMRGNMDGIDYQLESKAQAKRGQGAGTKDLQKLADEHGLPYATVLNRYYKGWRGEALVRPVTKHLITYRGQTRTLREWANHLGIPYARVLARYKRHPDQLHKVFNRGLLNSSGPTEFTDYRKHLITYQGKTQTVSEWADELGLPYNRIYIRLLRGETDPEKILCESLRKPIIHLTYKGETKDLKQWAKELGLKYRTVLRRIERGETDPEKILQPVEPTPVKE